MTQSDAAMPGPRELIAHAAGTAGVWRKPEQPGRAAGGIVSLER